MLDHFKSLLLPDPLPAGVLPLAGTAFVDTLPRLLGEAKSTIDVIQYQWKWYKYKPDSSVSKLSRAVLDAARRGVKVRILLNKENPGNPLTSINLESKQYLDEAGCQVKFGPSFPATHAKLWLIDDELVVLGSHNLSERACLYNDETSVLIQSGQVLAYFRNYFDLIWNRL